MGTILKMLISLKVNMYPYLLAFAFISLGAIIGFLTFALLKASKDPEENTHDHE